MQHHAFVIEGEAEEGIALAQAWAERELGVDVKANPDVAVMRYGLLSIEDARRVVDVAAQAPFAGVHKVIIIAASRAYHEAQNSLLKLFEEPPQGTYLFLILPSLGGLLPTLRSRVQILEAELPGSRASKLNPAEAFMKATKEKRTAMIKRIAAHASGDAVGAREEAIAIVNGIEAAAYAEWGSQTFPKYAELLSDIATLRTHLYDRSAPVRMILEHLSLVIPKELAA